MLYVLEVIVNTFGTEAFVVAYLIRLSIAITSIVAVFITQSFRI